MSIREFLKLIPDSYHGTQSWKPALLVELEGKAASSTQVADQDLLLTIYTRGMRGGSGIQNNKISEYVVAILVTQGKSCPEIYWLGLNHS